MFRVDREEEAGRWVISTKGRPSAFVAHSETEVKLALQHWLHTGNALFQLTAIPGDPECPICRGREG